MALSHAERTVLALRALNAARYSYAVTVHHADPLSALHAQAVSDAEAAVDKLDAARNYRREWSDHDVLENGERGRARRRVGRS